MPPLEHIFVLTAIAALLMLWISEATARRQADEHNARLRAHLDDAISIQIDQYEEIERLRPALAAATSEANAANLRAQRAINSLRALPELKIRCPLPAEQTGVTPFNLN